MTLIVNTTNFSYPILIGDILMSTQQVKKNTSIPTFLGGVDNLLPPEQKLFPFSLKQKIYVITENLAIGLAGSQNQMKMFFNDITEHFSNNPSSSDNINQFFEEYDFSNFDKSACILLYTELSEKGVLVHQKVKGPWETTKSPSFEYVFACGSGSQYFIENAKKNNYYGNIGDDNPLYRAISLNYINLSTLLSVERLSLETIRQSWGAGFEMIFFNGEKFEKLDDVTFIIWKDNVDLNTENYSVAPFLTLNFKYCDDILLISASDFKTVEGYAVLPLTMKRDEVDQSKFPKQPNFKSHKICCTYVLELSNGKISTPSFFVESKEYPGSISIDFNSEGGIEVMVQTDVENFLIENLKHLIKENRIN